MIDVNETVRALQGAAQLAIGRSQGMAAFGRDIDAFWRSFSAMLVAAPILAVLLASEYALIGSEAGVTPPALARFLIVKLIHYPVDWLAFPLAMIFLSRLIGVTQRYGAYVIVLNWTTVIIIAAYAVPVLLHALLGVPGTIAFLLWLGILLAALRLRWLVARLALGVDGLMAAGLVFIEFALGLILMKAFDALL